MFIPRGDSATTWDGDNAKKVYGFFEVAYSNLGAIRPGLSYEIIAARGTTLANTMGNYAYLTNNCDTFARRLYSDIR
jgi:hypothetical protein